MWIPREDQVFYNKFREEGSVLNMKKNNTPALWPSARTLHLQILAKGLVLILLTLSPFGKICGAPNGNTQAQQVVFTNLEPYRNVGLVLNWTHEFVGSASVARFPNVVIGCAHVAFDEDETFTWSNDLEFFHRWNSTAPPPQGSGIRMRGTFSSSSYANIYQNRVQQYGGTDRRTYAYDFSVYWTYEEAADGNFAGWYQNGRAALEGGNEALAVGYPAIVPNQFLMYRHGPWTPGLFSPTGQFEQEHGNYLIAEGISTRGGASGGPVYVKNILGSWGLAGVLVGGNDTSIGVLAMGAEEWALVESASGSSPFMQPVVTSHPTNRSVLEPDSASFNVNATGSDPLSFQWQRSTNGGASWSNLIGETSSTYNTGATTTVMNGYRYRVVVSNNAGSTVSNAAILTVETVEATPLANNQMISNLSGTTNSERHFRIEVPPGQSELIIRIFGGSGDADLYVRHGSPPTLSQYDHRPFLAHNDETVNIPFPAQGDWYVMIHAFSAYAGLSLQAGYSDIFVQPPESSLGESLGAPDLEWTTGGNAPWFTQSTVTHGGAAAAASGNIGDNEESWIQTVVTGPGTLRFYWKVSSEADWDILHFFLNGSEQFRISGEEGWKEEVVEIPDGAHTLRWVYSKDGSLSRGQDRGWLDEVRFTPAQTVFAGAFDGGNHRKYLDWFGWYNDEHWPWIWDYQFGGWLWVVDNGPDNVWFWHNNQQNWMWTRPDWYRWVWFQGGSGLTWRSE